MKPAEVAIRKNTPITLNLKKAAVHVTWSTVSRITNNI